MSNVKENPVLEETTVFDIEKINVNKLPELQGWKEKQKQVLKENPFVPITDNKSYEEAKKARTTLVTARTTIEKQDKLIASKLKKFRSFVSNEIKNLVSITSEAENKQQAEVKRYEAEKEKERIEKERIEKERKEAIQNDINSFFDLWKQKIKELKFEDKANICFEFIPAIEEFSKRDFEEFEIDFTEKTEELKGQLKQRIDYLEEQEEARIERKKLAAERAELERQKAEAEAKRKEEEAEAERKRNIAEKRAKQLQPYIVFIRDYNSLISKNEEDYQSEFAEIKKGAEDHWEFERKQQLKKQKEEEAAEAEAKRKAAKVEAENKRLEKEREKLAAERADLEKQKAAEAAAKKAAEAAAKKAEAEAKKAEAEAKKAEAEKERLKELQPDIEKLSEVINSIGICSSKVPSLKDEKAIQFYNSIETKILEFKSGLIQDLQSNIQ